VSTEENRREREQKRKRGGEERRRTQKPQMHWFRNVVGLAHATIPSAAEPVSGKPPLPPTRGNFQHARSHLFRNLQVLHEACCPCRCPLTVPKLVINHPDCLEEIREIDR
jgi:hypothetical protein